MKTEKMLTDAADASVDVCNAAGDAAQVWQFIKTETAAIKSQTARPERCCLPAAMHKTGISAENPERII